MIFSNESDYKMCMEVVRKELNKRNVCVSDENLDRITRKVMNITYAKGGDYSYSTIQAFTEGYMDNESYKKYLDS